MLTQPSITVSAGQRCTLCAWGFKPCHSSVSCCISPPPAAACCWCRTRWLAPGGIILPDAAQLYVTGVDDRQYLGEQSKLWGNRRMGPGDGFAVKPVLNAVIKHPRVDSMTRSQVVTDAQQLLSLDLYSASLQVGGVGRLPAVLVDSSCCAQQLHCACFGTATCLTTWSLVEVLSQCVHRLVASRVKALKPPPPPILAFGACNCRYSCDCRQ